MVPSGSMEGIKEFKNKQTNKKKKKKRKENEEEITQKIGDQQTSRNAQKMVSV